MRFDRGLCPAERLFRDALQLRFHVASMRGSIVCRVSASTGYVATVRRHDVVVRVRKGSVRAAPRNTAQVTVDVH